ncbi:aminotransferase class IV [Maribellus sp. CM-23]|uniref:aminotransferase class IV n=1 Tax=Maribellus sp. CM-23 TaxID=2781026 RepID=UPI001F464109|nr:aminotransferase class IV [Maribellus sp. CM-23]MCE4562687.1 aminotransferase class IV [Maribellus sp. CM-23]
MKTLIVNGEVCSLEEVSMNRWLLDDPVILSQKVWFGYGGIPLLNENVESLHRQTQELGALLPSLFRNQRELFRLCKRMLNKNRFYRSGTIHIRLYVSAKTVNYLITSEAREIFDFPISEQGMLVNVSQRRKPLSQLGSYPFYSRLLWETARNTLRNEYRNSILLNDKNYVCEGIAATLFMVKDRVLITPSTESGCCNPVIREMVLKLGHQMGLKVMEVPELEKELLFHVEELFLVSEATGIEWILGLENKRFVRSFSLDLHNELNLFLQNKVAN